MTDVKTIDQLSLILGYIVPGIIIIYIRSQFLTGRIGPHKDALLSYFTLSVIYLTILNVVVLLVTGKSDPLPEQTQYWLLFFLVGAFIFGLLVGINAYDGLTRGLMGRINLNMPHALNSAWDWRFSRFPPSLMTITLKDGSTVSGWCGSGSFIGSDPADRDLYIEQVYDVDNR